MKRKSIILLITLGSRRRHRIFQEGRRETAFPFRRISRKLAGVADESNFVVAPVGKSSPFHFFFFFLRIHESNLTSRSSSTFERVPDDSFPSEDVEVFFFFPLQVCIHQARHANI